MVRSLIATNTIQEVTQICWDLRLSERYPTLEFRVPDMCMTVDEAVMMAGLARGLMRTCYEQALLHAPYKAVRLELLRAAHWGASRWGLDVELVDVDAECTVPARELIEKFLDVVRPAVEEFGEWDEVYSIAHETMQQGNGAAWQRGVYKHTGSLEDVVDFIVRETAKGTTAV
jgi:carboxylate-amine ligase